MKNTIRPCNPATLRSSSTEQEHHTTYGSSSSQAEWQGNIAALRQAGKLPSFRGNTAFDAVAEARFTYGKPEAAPRSPSIHVNGYGVACSGEKNAKDKRQSSSHIRDFIPKTMQPDYPVAKQPSEIVAASQSDRVAKRFRVNKVDPATKEETSFLVTVTTNVVTVLSYGTVFEFSHSNRAKATFGDSRDGKRKPLSFAKSELRRILGATEGDAKFRELTTFTLPPCNPATPKPEYDSQGIRVPASQGV